MNDNRVPVSNPVNASYYQKAVLAFVESQEQKVLLIHGRWGTGKTYFWRHFVARERGAIRETFYSYVSLFGTSSISNIKSLVIFGGEALREPGGIDEILERLKTWVARKRKYLAAVKVPYFGDVGSMLPSFEELLIKDYLVCFDDLERRNRSLDLEQFFGLVSVLKEQNSCRIVIICNEEELVPRDRRILAKYREKIIDRQITYEPDFEENFALIFPQGDETICEVFRALHLNNIRVFQQTLWCVQYFEPYLVSCHGVFIQQFRRQCAKLACVHYALSKHLTFEQVKSESWLMAGWERRADIQTESSRLIEQLEFSPSEADDLIIDYLQNGYCDLTVLREVVSRLNENYKRGVAQTALRNVWALVYDNFRAGLEEIKTAASSCIEEFSNYLQIDQLKHLLDFLQDLDPSYDKKALLERLALDAVKTADFEILQQVQAVGLSEAVKSAIAKRREELIPKHTIADLVAALSHPDGWDPKNFVDLDQYSEDALTDWLSEADGSRLLGDLAIVFVRARTSIPEDVGAGLLAKLQRTMEKFRRRSKLDAFRVEKYFSARVKAGLAERGINE